MSDTEIPYDPAKVPRDGDWRLLSDDPVTGLRRWQLLTEDDRIIIKTEHTKMETVLAVNRADYNESYGQRWGGGKRIASIPMHIFFRQIQPRLQQRDDKSLSNWLNDPDNRGFRTFRGKV